MALRRNAKIELIKRVPLFALCSKTDLGRIAAIADEVHVEAGRELTTEGARGREFFVLVQGGVEVRQRSRKVNELGDGDFFGEVSLVARAPRNATITTTSPSRLLVVTDREFGRLLRDVPAIQEKVMRALAQRLVPTNI